MSCKSTAKYYHDFDSTVESIKLPLPDLPGHLFCLGISRPGPIHQLSLMAGPTGLFNFTSSACATQLRITVSIPFYYTI
jgi:hypothetical protein